MDLRGKQIVYIPSHLWGEPLVFDYPNGAQPGFILSTGPDKSSYYCRYWRISKGGQVIPELRTLSNSELTPTDCLIYLDTVDQHYVERAIAGIEEAV